jgi:hypothetical protein
LEIISTEGENLTVLGTFGEITIKFMFDWLSRQAKGWVMPIDSYVEVLKPSPFKTGKASTRIGVYDMPVSASGMMLVEIDGNKSLANHLPQVSELITIGTLSSSVLIAQGGTLNPTDRIYYQKSTAGTSIADPHSSGFDNLLCQNRKVLIASNLQPGEHTIRFIHTGYSAMGQENKNFRISGIWFDDPSTRMGYPGVGFEFKDIQDIHCPESDNNFAFRYRPEGATYMDHYEWLGHQNGTQ